MSRIINFVLLAVTVSLVACQRDAGTTAEQASAAEAPPGAATAAETSPAESPTVDQAEFEGDLYAYRSWTIDEIGTADALAAACEQEVGTMQAAIVALESFEETPTIENYSEALNAQVVSVSNMAMASNTLGAVHPDEHVRAAADACSQSLSPIFSDLSLSRPIYDRVSAIDLPGQTRKPSARTRNSFSRSSSRAWTRMRRRVRASNNSTTRFSPLARNSTATFAKR